MTCNETSRDGMDVSARCREQARAAVRAQGWSSDVANAAADAALDAIAAEFIAGVAQRESGRRWTIGSSRSASGRPGPLWVSGSPVHPGEEVEVVEVRDA